MDSLHDRDRSWRSIRRPLRHLPRTEGRPSFDGDLLARAIRATFERRKTALPTTTPVALTAAFAEDATKKTQWSGFVRKAGVRDAGSLADAIAAVQAFVGAPLAAAANGTPAPGTWRAGGAWG